MDNYICPICSKSIMEVRAWVHCPKEKEKVCMNHCYDICRHMNVETGHCLYRLHSTNKEKRA